jgi:hypothetical protein
VKSAPLRLAMANGSPCLVLWWRGVMVEAKLYFLASDFRLV